MVWTSPLPNVRAPDDEAPIQVLQAPGDDLAGAGAVPVGQHHQGDPGQHRFLDGRVLLLRLGPAAPCADDRGFPAGTNLLTTSTAASSSPPGLPRRSSTTPRTSPAELEFLRSLRGLSSPAVRENRSRRMYAMPVSRKPAIGHVLDLDFFADEHEGQGRGLAFALDQYRGLPFPVRRVSGRGPRRVFRSDGDAVHLENPVARDDPLPLGGIAIHDRDDLDGALAQPDRDADPAVFPVGDELDLVAVFPVDVDGIGIEGLRASPRSRPP